MVVILKINNVTSKLLLVVGVLYYSILQTTNAAAQVTQSLRYERPEKKLTYSYKVISLGEEGLTLLQDQRKKDNNNLSWNIILLDTTLQERNKFELKTNQPSEYVSYQKERGKLFLLFRVKRNIGSNFELIEIMMSNWEVRRHRINLEIIFELSHFIKVGNSFAFGGYSKNEPLVFTYNTLTDALVVVPTFFKSSAELVDLKVNQDQTFNVVTIDRILPAFKLIVSGVPQLIFRTYDQYGKLLLEDFIPIGDDRIALQNVISSGLAHNDLFAFGTWGTINSTESLGLFSVGMNPFSDQKIAYHSFEDLNIKMNSWGIRNPSKECVNSYRILEYSGGYLLLAETYILKPPLLANGTLVQTPNYGPHYYNPHPSASEVLTQQSQIIPRKKEEVLEYEKNKALVIAFDAEGKLTRQFSFNLRGIRLLNPEQLSDFVMTANKIYLAFKVEHTINFEWIELRDDSAGTLEENIRSVDLQDVIQSEDADRGEARAWYGNSFFVWGYQTIKNKAMQGDRTRHVFYVTKVDVH